MPDVVVSKPPELYRVQPPAFEQLICDSRPGSSVSSGNTRTVRVSSDPDGASKIAVERHDFKCSDLGGAFAALLLELAVGGLAARGYAYSVAAAL